MKILLPLDLFYPSKLGGPANTLYWLAKAFTNVGIDVSVVTSNKFIEDKDIKYNEWVNIDKIRVRYCTGGGKLSYKIIWYSIKEMRKCHVVLFSSICFLPNLFILLFALLFQKKVLWSPRGELFESAINSNKWKLLYFRLIRHLITKKVVFHATSQDEKKCIEKYFPYSDIIIIPNYMELPQKMARQKNLQPYLLYVGRIAPIKALDHLIKALAQSHVFLASNFVLKIVGDVEEQFKSYYDELIQLINENGLMQRVEFVGPRFGKEKYQMFSNAYFSFLVSKSENFGNVVLESLSQGTPVVASLGTPWEVLIYEKAGFWINNDINSIATCIDNILNISVDEYSIFRKNAYLLSMKYDVNMNISAWKKILN